jgi:hypothetical protein
MSSRIIAEALALRGFSVFPLKAGAKTPPLWKDWPNKSSTVVPADWPTIANVGIHCAGLVVVDVDPRNGGFESLMEFELECPLPATLETITPSGGRHLFYCLPPGHPGVINRAHALGRGIDVKSTNGYVVGAGSRTDAGEYRFVDPAAEIADAPDWLVQPLGRVTTAEKAEHTTVADAEPAVVERAESWLKIRDPAIEGCGGDAHTFATACMLRDYGLSELQTLELMAGEWNDRCSPPWEHADLEAKVAHAYAYAQNAAGSRAVTSDDFPNLSTAEPAAEQPKRSIKAVSFDEMTAAPFNKQYIIKDLLQRSEYAGLYGAPGQGKTFVALDLAYHVAAGKPWMGRKVKQGSVLYIGFEAYGGLPARALALKRHYGNAGVPLYFAPGGFNVRDPAGWQTFGEVLGGLPEVPSLIIFDTFAYALAGGDENDAKEVGGFNDAAQRIISQIGACVMVIHHTGKDTSRGARGSSALPAALDTEISIADNQITPTKQRSGELGDSMGFRLQPIQIGIDEDGDLVSSCVVIPDAASASKGDNTPRPGTTERFVWDELCKARVDNSPINGDDLRALCASFLPRSDSQARKSFHAALMRLQGTGQLIIADGLITRKLE